MAGRRGDPDRQRDQARDGDRDPRRLDRGQLAVAALDDEAREPVEERRADHRQRAQELLRRVHGLDADDQRHAGQAEQHPGALAAVDLLAREDERRQQRDEQRRGRDQHRGQPARDDVLAEGDQQERRGDRGHGEDQRPTSGRSRRSRSVGPASARERSTANRTAEASRQRSGDDRRGREALERVLDQQVGAAPDRREHGEQRGVATGHACSVGLTGRQAQMMIPPTGDQRCLCV